MKIMLRVNGAGHQAEAEPRASPAGSQDPGLTGTGEAPARQKISPPQRTGI